jgi:hypothetical protein
MMGVSQLLDAMFPGDEARGLPAFSDLGEIASSIFVEVGYLDLELALETCSPEKEVNDILKFLRNNDFDLVQSFVGKALDVYFTHPIVVGALNQDGITLFPNHRILEDIDYDLLEQVVEQNLGRIT